MAENNEKKKSKVNKKQMYLLMGVLVLLLIILFVMFVIRPMLESISEKESQVQTLSDEYDGLVLKSQKYAASLSKYNTTKSKFLNQTDELFDLMYSDDADKNVLTPRVKQLGFTVNSVDISDLNVFMVDSQGTVSTDTITYKEAIEQSDVVPQDETEAETAPLATEAETSDGVTYGEASENLAGNDAIAETENTITNTGEYYYSLTYSLTGKYPDIVKLVKEISSDVAMSVESLTFQSVSDDNTKIEGDYSVTIVINLYMYEDPTTGINDPVDEETTSEETEGSSEITGEA